MEPMGLFFVAHLFFFAITVTPKAVESLGAPVFFFFFSVALDGVLG